MSPTARPRLSLYYAALFVAIGFYMPYFPLWLDTIGLDAATIGIVLTAPMVARLVALPFLGALADRFRSPAMPLRLYTFGAAAAIGALFLVSGPVAIAVVLGIAGAFWGVTVPVADAVAVRQSRAGGTDYGTVRVWGSAAFVAATVGGGWLVGVVTGHAVLPVLFIAFGAAAIASMLLRLPPDVEPLNLPSAPMAGGTLRFAVVVVAAGLVQASHAFVYAFGSIYWEARGFAPAVIGALWATGVVAEIVLFRYGRHILSRVSPATLIGIGAAAAVVRWIAMALEPGLASTFLVQALPGLSFGATHLGLVFFISEAVPPRRASAAQAVAASTMGIGMASLTAVSGLLYAALGANGFLAMAATGSAGLAVLVAGLALVSRRVRDAAATPAASGAGDPLVVVSVLQPQSAGSAGTRVEPS